MAISELGCSQAASNFHHTAIVQNDRSVTYQQLERQSSDIAKGLHAHGVREGDRVVVLTTRCLEMAVLFIGVLKAGACYVPLDVESLSQDRIRQTLDRVRPALVIETGRQLQLDCIVFPFENILAAGAKTLTCELSHIRPDPESLAYIIFTSGTTSMPKGVMVPRRALFNYVQQGQPDTPFNMRVTHRDIVISIFSPAFDACIGVVFSTLYNGGTLMISSPETLQSDLEMCTILPCTPSILRTLNPTARYPRLNAVFLGGEAPSPDLVRAWAAPQRAIHNCYGPSETTCASLISKLSPDGPIDLGLPMPNAPLLLMKDGVPAVEGEIWISGPGLASGYLEDPVKTASKFVRYNGRRFYCTGDYAQRKDDRLFFLGRGDSIVKNRGFLINLETEVVPALVSVECVISAVALHHQDQLCGFVTPASCIPDNIRASMRIICDSFIVPDVIVALKEFPLTPNGKIDQARLRELVAVRSCSLPREQRPYTSVDTKLDLLIHAVQESLNMQGREIRHAASFLQHGGNSLSAIRLLSILHDHNLTLSLADLLAGPDLTTTAAYLKPRVAVSPSDKPRDLGRAGALSALQLQLLGSMADDPTTYYMLINIEFSTDVFEHQHQLRAAWETIYRRHTILRARFDIESESYQDQPEFRLDFQWKTYDVPDMLPVYQQEAHGMWDLARSSESSNPATAFRLMHAPSHPSRLLWLVHHSRVDGFSIEMILRELQAIFAGRGLPSVQSFCNASRVQNELSKCSSKEANAFWGHIQILSSAATPLELPKISSIPNNTELAEVFVESGIALDKAEKTCSDNALLLSTLVYAAWGRVMSTYTNASTCSFGVVFSGRNLPMRGASAVVGPMISVCPFPVRPMSGNAVQSWLREVHAQNLQMAEFQWSRSPDHERDPTLHDFDTLVSIQYGITEPMPDGSSPLLNFKTTQHQKSAFAWTLLIEIAAGQLVFRLLYNSTVVSSQISSQALSQFHDSLHTLLTAVGKTSTRPDTTFTWLPMSRYGDLIQHPRQYAAEIPVEHTSLRAAIEHAVSKYPNLVALQSPAISMTYGQLNKVATTLANCVAQSTEGESPVAIIADGSPNWIISILAVVKAGFPYCAIDNKMPNDRIHHMLRISGARMILMPSAACSLPSDLEETLIKVDVPDILASKANTPSLPAMVRRTDNAYLTFTSGTTGLPKSIFITNRGLLSYISYPPARLDAKPGVRVAQTFSSGFDACAAEIFGTLCYGGTLVLKSPNDVLCALRHATAAMMTPSLLETLDTKEFPNLKTIVLGGEAVSQKLVNAWAPKRKLYNGYGPCECTIGAVFKHLSRGQPVTLGSPIPGMRAYVLHQDLSIAPIGVPGEIYLSGEQVAEGYHTSDSREQKRFRDDPWAPGQRMFRTGDFGRWNESMELEFLGRRDRQIKLDGYRINLEEVETVMTQCSPNISRACVLVKNNRLVGFVSGRDIDIKGIISTMRSEVPHYCMPHSIQRLEEFPQTSNQKVDYRALDSMVIQSQVPDSELGLRTQTEQDIACIWRDVLNLLNHALGPDEDFISLGGYSMLQLRLATRLSQHFGCSIPLSIIAKHPRLADQAKAIEVVIDTSSRGLEASKVTPDSFLDWCNAGSVPNDDTLVSSTDQEMLTLTSRFTRKSAFNISCVFQITGALELQHLAAATQKLLARSKILRTRFIENSSTYIRKIDPSLSIIALGSGLQTCMPQFEELVTTPFNPEKEQLIRFHLHMTDKGRSYLLIKAHHAIMDAPGLHALLQDISRYYAEAARGLNIASLDEAPADTLDYLNWKSQHAPSIEATQYWNGYLQSPPQPLFSLQELHSQNALLNNTAESMKFLFPPITTPTKSHTTQEILITRFLLALATTFQLSDIIIAIPFSHRRELGTESLIGNLLDRVPIRLRLDPQSPIQAVQHDEGTFDRVCDKVAKDIRNASRYALPFDQILSASEALELIQGDMFPFCQAVLSFHRADDYIQATELQLEGCDVEFVANLKPDGAMFPLLLEVWEQRDGSFKCELRWIKIIAGDIIKRLIRAI